MSDQPPPPPPVFAQEPVHSETAWSAIEQMRARRGLPPIDVRPAPPEGTAP